MLFRVDPDGTRGLADQISAQVRGALVSGELSAGDRLPPARQVAAGLGVNMHTVLRAYAALRDDGLIDLRRGRGAVVRDEIDPAVLAIDRDVMVLARRALRLGWSAERTAQAVRAAMVRPGLWGPADDNSPRGAEPSGDTEGNQEEMT